MNKVIKQKWVRALRSGKYEQTTEQLDRRTDAGVEHCCLGVLRRVQGCTRYSEGSAPSSKYKAGLTEQQINQLISLNDGDKVSFNIIAAFIEANY